jgi:hypothetical protein
MKKGISVSLLFLDSVRFFLFFVFVVFSFSRNLFIGSRDRFGLGQLFLDRFRIAGIRQFYG